MPRALRVSYRQTRQCNFAICDVVIDPFGDKIILIGSIATDTNKRALFKKLAVDLSTMALDIQAANRRARRVRLQWNDH